MSERLPDSVLAEIEAAEREASQSEDVVVSYDHGRAITARNDHRFTSLLRKHARALVAEVRFMKERYEPKDCRWSGMSYYEWVNVLNHSHGENWQWQKKCETAAADERQAIVAMLQRELERIDDQPEIVKLANEHALKWTYNVLEGLILDIQARGDPASLYEPGTCKHGYAICSDCRRTGEYG